MTDDIQDTIYLETETRLSDLERPPDPPEPDAPPAEAEASAAAAIQTRWTAHELLTTVFPAPRWFVPKYIPYGYILLGGRPKIGKSWFALQLAIATGSGGRVFEEIIPRAKVLYLALEDSPRRLQDRIKKMGAQDTSDIVFYTQWEPFTEGGFATLQAEIIAHEYKLIIIDTLARALVGKRRIDQNDIQEMTAIGSNLQTMTTTRDITILATDHHTKPSGFDADPIDDLLGSTGKTAVADCIMGLYREQGKQGAILKSRGRDSEDLDLALEWDVMTGCWQMLGDADDIRKDSLAADIMTAIQAITEDGNAPTTTRIANFLGKAKGNISSVLSDLVFTGKLRRGSKVGREVPYERVPE